MDNNSRRKFITRILGGLGVTVLAAWLFRKPIVKNLFFNGDFNPELLNNAPSDMNDLCILTSTQAEGPFYFPSPNRKDMREDRKGQNLALEFQVLKQDGCTPIEGAIVDLWHCDAEGTYSGYPVEITRDIWKTALFVGKNGTTEGGEMHVDPVNDNRFLRGRQTSNKDGWVSFETILPGWYVGRVPHIHAKIIIDQQEELLTQFYFDTELCDHIYTSQEPYNQYGKCPMQFKDDIVLSENDEANGLVLKIKPESDRDKTLKAIAKIGIRTA